MPGAITITPHQLTALLADVALITLLARALGVLARRVGQPAVIGEILAGVALGPTLFGGALAHRLLPLDVRPLLSVLANLGLVLFMFCTGLELDHRLVARRGRAVTAVSLGSTAFPAALGVCVAIYLAPRHAVHDRPAFVLFMAAAMSVTAFPVLARILADRGLSRTSLGQMALACAAAGDVLAWLVLAAALVLSNAAAHSWWHIALVVPYVLVIVKLVRPLLSTLTRSGSLTAQHPAQMIAVIIPAALASAAATTWLGLSAASGAFLLGAALAPHTRAAVGTVISRGVDDLSRVMLLPIYFVTAGIQVNLGDIGAGGVADLLLIVGVAVLGKVTGTFLGARWARVSGREAAGLASLMNARGLTELVVLTIGLQSGVLDHQVYSLMVAMALITTAMAGPLLGVIYPAGRVLLDPSCATPGRLAAGGRPVV